MIDLAASQVNEMVGCLFIAYSVPLWILWMIIRHDAKLTIICVSSAFFYILAMLLSACIWLISGSGDDKEFKEDAYVFFVFLSVLLQETFRWLFWKLIKKADVEGLKIHGVSNNRAKTALVAGHGYGMISGIVGFNSVLTAATGPGTLQSRGCPEYSMFLISALVTAAFMIFNIFWSVIMFDALEVRSSNGNRGGWIGIIGTVVCHLVCSLLTLNLEKGGECAGTMVPLYLILIGSGYWAKRVSGFEIHLEGLRAGKTSYRTD